MENRLQFVDAIKGLAIILIAVGHALPPQFVEQYLSILAYSMITLFFFSSGYFFDPEKCCAEIHIKTRAKKLLKPFFTYSLSLWAIGSIYLLAAKKETITDALCCLRNFYVGCIWNRSIQNIFAFEYHNLGKMYPFLAVFWFLITMFLANVLLAMLSKIAFRTRTRCLCTAIALMLLGGLLANYRSYLPYNLHTAFFFCGIMMLGTIARQTGFPQKSVLPNKLQWLVGFACTFAIFALLPWFSYSGANAYRGDFGEPQLLGMICATIPSLVLIYGLFRLFYNLESSNIRLEKLSFLGKNSMDLFLLHVFIFWIIGIISGRPVGVKGQSVNIGEIGRSLMAIVVAIIVSTIFALIKKHMAKKISQTRS